MSSTSCNVQGEVLDSVCLAGPESRVNDPRWTAAHGEKGELNELQCGRTQLRDDPEMLFVG